MWCAAVVFSLPAVALEVDRSHRDGTIVVSAELPHSVSAVRSLLADESVTMRLGKNIRDVKVTPLANGCAELAVTNRAMRRELRYVSERCPTADGWHSKMVSSDDFVRHDIQWAVRPENNHAKVLIFVDVELKTIVPGWMVDRFVVNALEGTLRAMNEILSTTDSPISPPLD